jgi:hypothetical protein
MFRHRQASHCWILEANTAWGPNQGQVHALQVESDGIDKLGRFRRARRGRPRAVDCDPSIRRIFCKNSFGRAGNTGGSMYSLDDMPNRLCDGQTRREWPRDRRNA